MKANLGSADRVLRTIGAVVLLGVYFGKVVTGALGLVVLAVAALLLATSVFSFCPAYALFGFSTRKPEA